VEKKMVVMVVTGRLGDKVEWSFGEAAPYNNKNSYPYAMAEKRAKDRVILKLVGLHGDAYSEDEADDFKESNPDLVKDDNDRLISPSYINNREVVYINQLLKEKSADKAAFLKWAKVKRVEDILVTNYPAILTVLEAKK
jgi:hypothetical protein